MYSLTLRRYVIRWFRGTIVLRRNDGVHRRPVIRERGDVAHIYRRHPLHPVNASRVVRVRVLVAGAAALSSRARRRGVRAGRAACIMLRRVREAQRFVRYRAGRKARRYTTHVT